MGCNILVEVLMDPVTGQKTVKPTVLNIRARLTGILPHSFYFGGNYSDSAAVKWRPQLIKLLWYISASK
jgi:hypothetical protein